MSDEEIRIKLAEMQQKQDQWHDDFLQRDKHWLVQRGFWYVTVGIGIGALLVKAFS